MYQRIDLLQKKCNHCLETAIPITVFEGENVYEKCPNCRTLKQGGTMTTSSSTIQYLEIDYSKYKVHKGYRKAVCQIPDFENIGNRK